MHKSRCTRTILHRLAALTVRKRESHKDNFKSQIPAPNSSTTEMADNNLLMLESYIDADRGFDSDVMDFDELDCSDPLAMSGRCDLHRGLRIEVTKEPLSMRHVANIVIALQRLKPSKRFQSTEFTDQELLRIFMENVIEESVMINLTCSESKSYSMQDKVVQCTICDKSKRALVQKEKLPFLMAITLKGGNEKNKAWFNLSSYTPPNCTENTKGQPVCLGIVKSNFFLSCTLDNDTPFLGIEEVKDKQSLKAIKENDGMERFLFFRNGTGDSLNTFESVKYPGWFITTSKDDFKPVQMSNQQPSHLQLFTLHDEKIVGQNEV